MSSSYLEQFAAAHAWSERHAHPRLNHSISLDPRKQVDMDRIIDALEHDFADFVTSTDSLRGHCFQVVREISYVLFDLRVRHAVTIGDVTLPNGPYVGTSKQRLKRELRQGYKLDFDHAGRPVEVPAHAHAWITLENGQVIDGTILSSINHSAGRPPLALKDAFYHSGLDTGITHVPLVTGFAYHYLVLTHPVDRFYPTYTQWYEDYFRLDASL